MWVGFVSTNEISILWEACDLVGSVADVFCRVGARP